MIYKAVNKVTTFMCAHVADIQIDVAIVKGCFSRGRTVFGYVLIRVEPYRGHHIVQDSQNRESVRQLISTNIVAGWT